MATVRVKIAVAVGPSGKWNAAGWSQAGTSFPVDDEVMMDDAALEGFSGAGQARYWVMATLQVPEAQTQTIEGEVETAT